MSVALEADHGADVRIYADASGALAMTRLDHVLEAEDRRGWMGDSDREYCPAAMSLEAWFGADQWGEADD